ncbi:UDP-N-acetylmuramate dehydrogenase [Patescibacteria group bacterium]|nr:UDP-N-acetylmuramate dehydrogenase [Patescibacteria group bacterium]
MEIKVEKNVDLNQFTTYHTGGPAKFFARVQNWQQMLGLREFARVNKIPYLILGGGSNILFADEGYPGLVIMNQMDKVRIHQHTITAESAVNLMKLVVIAAKNNLGGISGLANVPGSVGGAVYGNAGVSDVCISDVFMHAEILPTNGNKPIIVGQDYCQFGYRTSRFKETKDIILSATLKLQPAPAPLIQSQVSAYVKQRTLKQPVGMSCGSFFKNPGEFPSAGWLIEQSGCKGMKVGGAQVSEKHANFILNTGTATSSDIVNLALKVHKKVEEKYSVKLEPEVQILPGSPFKNLKT